MDVLSSVTSHTSRASGSYYLKNKIRYFSDAYESLMEIFRVLKVGCSGYFVIQNSYYKEIEIPLYDIYCEMALSIGFSEAKCVREDQVKAIFGQINTKSKNYIKDKVYFEKNHKDNKMNDVTKLLSQIDEKRDEVVTDSYTISWREVINLYKENEITISPDYQRLFRWDNARQSQFIESLLLNIPTPTLFFYIDNNGKQEVIDGLQRVSTIIRFFSEDIFNKEEIDNAKKQNSVNDVRNPTVLDDVPIITELNGWTAKGLPDKVSRTIKNARVNVVILEQETKPETKYNVFKRLNRSGVRLSDQEIRNCMARLAGNEFADRLRKMAEIDGIVQALGINEDGQKSQGVEEALLRVMASLTYADKFSHSVTDFLMNLCSTRQNIMLLILILN